MHSLAVDYEDDEPVAAPPATTSFDGYITQCGHGSILGQNRETGEIAVVPLCCKSWACPDCAKRLARLWAKRAAEAKPERFLTITADPARSTSPHDAYLKMKKAFQQFVAKWRRRKKVFEYLAIWELQKSGWPHLHVLQKGHYVPIAYIRAWFDKADIGTIDDIRRVQPPENAAAYVVKYTGKATPVTKRLIGHQRLILMSRHFMPQEPLDAAQLIADDWQWTYLQTRPDFVLQIITYKFGYKVNTDRFPYQITLLPDRIDVPLDELASELDPGWLDRNFKTEQPTLAEQFALQRAPPSSPKPTTGDLFTQPPAQAHSQPIGAP